MAGPQSKSLSKWNGKPYPVPDKNQKVSATYFNSVKSWMEKYYSKEVQKWISFFGEKEFWQLVHDEMYVYTFNFEDNQALFIYTKYKEFLNESEKKSCG